MNIVTNEKTIQRNSRIGQVTMLVSLVILAAGMYISFAMPEQFWLSLAALFIGFVLSQVGIYFSNRWGRRPRPYELINQSLKGLDKSYSIYHYAAGSPTSHLLVGPAGVWVLMPMHQGGTISYSKNRYRQKGGNLYLKIFAQEGLGRPDLEIQAEQERVQRFLQEQLGEDAAEVPVQTALVFTNQKANVVIDPEENPPAVTVTLKDLKDVIRKAAKDRDTRLSPEKMAQIQAALPPE